MTEPGDQGEARIEAALSRLGAEHEPPPGWEARVLAALGPERRRRPWWVFAAPGLAVAVSAAIVVLVVRPPKQRELEVAVRRKDLHQPLPVTRSAQPDEYQIGETIQVTVSGGAHRALWVYRDDRELVIACPRAPACQSLDDGISVDFVLKTVGEYKVFALSANASPPEPSGNYDADTAAIMRARIEPQVRKFHVP